MIRDKQRNDGEENLQCCLCETADSETLYTLEDFSVVRCVNCGLVFLAIAVDRAHLEEMYDDQYFDERREYFFDNPIVEKSNVSENPTIQSFCSGLSLIEQYASRGRLLDVGCAVGVFLSLAKDAGWEAHGVDISNYAVSYCRDTLGHKAYCGDLRDIGLPDREYDVVTLWDVIEHLVDPVAQLKEAHRILKKDGIVLVDTPNEDSLIRSVARAMYIVTGGSFKYPVRKLYHHFHLFYFNRDTLRTVFEKSGFTLVHLESRPISAAKGRAGLVERAIVDTISIPERVLKREYELVAIARKLE